MAIYKNINEYGKGGHMIYVPISFVRTLGDEKVCVFDKESDDAIHLYSRREAKKRGIPISLRNTKED